MVETIKDVSLFSHLVMIIGVLLIIHQIKTVSYQLVLYLNVGNESLLAHVMRRQIGWEATTEKD